MPVLLRFAISVLLGYFGATRVDGLQCYQCSYPTTAECRDYPTISQLGTCARGILWCITSTSREFGEIEVIRRCYENVPPNNRDAAGCHQEDGDPRKICYCQGDACNQMPSGYPTDVASNLFISNYCLLVAVLFAAYHANYFI